MAFLLGLPFYEKTTNNQNWQESYLKIIEVLILLMIYCFFVIHSLKFRNLQVTFVIQHLSGGDASRSFLTPQARVGTGRGGQFCLKALHHCLQVLSSMLHHLSARKNGSSL